MQTHQHLTEPVSETIQRLVQRIVAEVHPLRIILFGSAAHDGLSPDSDLDMLVVMPEGAHRRRTAQLLYRRIRGIARPFDILVATPSDLEKHHNNRGLIYRTILQEEQELRGEQTIFLPFNKGFNDGRPEKPFGAGNPFFTGCSNYPFTILKSIAYGGGFCAMISVRSSSDKELPLWASASLK